MSAPLAPHLAQLLHAHDDLDRRLERHQELLAAGDFRGACLEFHEFRAALLAHIDAEEQQVLPRYRTLRSWPSGGQPELFDAEHRQIRRMVAQLEVALATLGDGPLSPRTIVRLIEDEHPLKGVLEHHAAREERFLYPALHVLRPAAASN
ncbi:MAG: hypothetical protein CHACPFDD_03047 [Phycisphaerae bacterium]|nr:hypothetical protein [Phycisphaerae bacterium]